MRRQSERTASKCACLLEKRRKRLMENEFGVLRRRKNAIRHRSHFGGQVYGSGIRSMPRTRCVASATSTNSMQSHPPRARSRGPRLRSGSVPRTLYIFAQDTVKDHWCGSEQSFRAEDTRSGTPVKAGEAVIKEMTKRQVVRWGNGPPKNGRDRAGLPAL